MKQRYHISPKGHKEPTEDEIAKYRDPKRLLYVYQKAVRKPKQPLYKDPKAFLVLLLIVLLAYLITEVVEKREVEDVEPGVETVDQLIGLSSGK